MLWSIQKKKRGERTTWNNGLSLSETKGWKKILFFLLFRNLLLRDDPWPAFWRWMFYIFAVVHFGRPGGSCSIEQTALRSIINPSGRAGKLRFSCCHLSLSLLTGRKQWHRVVDELDFPLSLSLSSFNTTLKRKVLSSTGGNPNRLAKARITHRPAWIDTSLSRNLLIWPARQQSRYSVVGRLAAGLIKLQEKKRGVCVFVRVVMQRCRRSWLLLPIGIFLFRSILSRFFVCPAMIMIRRVFDYSRRGIFF